MVTSRAESEWDDEQQAWMLALAQYRAERHDCGHSLAESTDPKNEGRYVVDPPTRCFACDAIDRKQDEYAEVKRRSALLWSARLP